ncbi:MAG: hypothetical protein FWF78_07620 [Defluviitaleaceae bacterium]|nr:hypothetical protein [Defluviitaleaceae bacterium]
MRVFSSCSVETPKVSDIQCNSCGEKVEKNKVGYFHDHVSVSKTWGYHSPYDGEAHDIDLCIGCYKDWIAHFEIPPYPQGEIAV